MEKIRAINIHENWHIMLIELSARDVEMIAMCTDVSAASWYDVINYPLPVVTPLARWTKICSCNRATAPCKAGFSWDISQFFDEVSGEGQVN